MPTPLPVFKIILGAFRFLWSKRTRFIRALSIPITILFLVEIFPYFLLFEMGYENIPIPLLFLLNIGGVLIYYAAYILFAITCHRLVLMGNTDVPAYGMLSWTRREWWFLAYFILLPFIYLFSAALILMVQGLIKEFDSQILNHQIIFMKGDGIFLLMFLVALPSVYIFSRLSLLFPATAVDRDVDVDWAWKTSRKNGWRLTAIIVLLPIVFAVLRVLLWRNESTWMEDSINLLLGLILLAVEIVALSLSYKHLTENEVIEPDAA